MLRRYGRREDNRESIRTVFGDVVEVVPTNDDCASHLGRDNATGEDTAADRHLTSEGALLVCSTE